MRTLNVNQLKKIDRPYIQPIYFLHLYTLSETLYFSDRNFTYNSHDYEDYILDLSDIENRCRNLGGYDNTQITLQFKNDPIRSYNYLIEFFDDNSVERRYVEIYKLLIDTGEVFGSDVSTLIFKGEMGSPYEITEIGFNLDVFSMLFGKNAKLPLDVVDLADFPGADPDDVGKYRNIIYGSLKKVVCPWTDAGWLSTLTAAITATGTSIVISDAINAPATPFTTLCDSEQIRVTNIVTNTLTVTRAYGGTTGVVHNMGAVIYEMKTDFEAEVAQHPVKSIGDIYVKSGNSEWLRLVSGATKYISSGGRAYIRFSDKPKFEQKINVTATTVPDEGTHIHAIPAGEFSSKQCVPDGSAGPTGHANVIDGNTGSYCGIGVDVTVQAQFAGEVNLGTIARVQIWIYKNDTASTGYVQSPSGTNLQTLPANAGWFRVIKTSGMAWTDDVVVVGGASGNQIGEIYKIVEYAPAAAEATTHAATGIDVDVSLSGNSSANMVIGDVVACDVEGYADPDGNYGGVGTLIERPDWVRKHILIIGLGFVAGDIGASFATVGATYLSQISGGYKFAFVMHEVATQTMDLFEKMDLCSRSNMFETGGKFTLVFNLVYGSTSQMTFDDDNVKGMFKFSKTDVTEIKNKLRAHYLRDFTKRGLLGDICQRVKEVSDAASITKYGTLAEDLEFPCIGDLETMVVDVLEWLLNEKKELKKMVSFEAFWDSMILDHCDNFVVESNFWSGKKFKTIGLKERRAEQIIEIEGLQCSTTAPLDLDFRPYDLFIRDDYCYVCGVSYHDSKYYPAVAKILVNDSYYMLIDLHEHGTGETGLPETMGYWGIYVDASHNVYVCGCVKGTGEAAVARKISGSDLSSITWTRTYEPTADNTHLFNDIYRDGDHVYCAGWRYSTAYVGIACKLNDSDGSEDWTQSTIGSKCLGVGGLYSSDLYLFGNDADKRTAWKVNDTTGAITTAYTYDTNSKENFQKVSQDGTYWNVSGKYVDGSNYKFGDSCRIKKSDMVKSDEVTRNSAATTLTEDAKRIVDDGVDGYVVGEYYDLSYETMVAVFQKRALSGTSQTWEVKHAQYYHCQSAIGLYGNFFYVGTYSGSSYTGFLERRKKSDGLIPAEL